MKPSQYIAQHLYEQKRKSNCSSCSSQTSYLSGSKIFIAHCIRSHYCTIVKNKTKKRTWKPAFLLYLFLWMSECMILRHQKARALSMQWLRASLNIFFAFESDKSAVVILMQNWAAGKSHFFSRLAVTKRIDFVFVWALLSWPGSSVELVCLDGSRPRRKMMERKKLLRRILHVQMLLELGALWSMTDWTGGIKKLVGLLALTKSPY